MGDSPVVCVDASIYVDSLVGGPGADAADALLRGLLRDRVVGPSFLPAEVLSALRKCVHRRLLDDSEAG